MHWIRFWSLYTPPVAVTDWLFWWVLGSLDKFIYLNKLLQITVIRGSKSRNKVSVGEPADGSLRFLKKTFCYIYIVKYLYLTKKTQHVFNSLKKTFNKTFSLWKIKYQNYQHYEVKIFIIIIVKNNDIKTINIHNS